MVDKAIETMNLFIFLAFRFTVAFIVLLFVFGAIFGYFRAGELFLSRHWIGCALILVSMIFQQVIDLYINKKPKVTSLKSELITEESNDDIQLNVDSLPTSDLES